MQDNSLDIKPTSILEDNRPDKATLQHILSVADDAARKAGDLIRANIGARVKYSKTNYKDVVTEVSKQSLFKFLLVVEIKYKDKIL
jgi:fructose-1,6-bisphosphatase/inositol monophosphatase family enzyme